MDEKKVQAITDLLSADPAFAAKVIELGPKEATKEFAVKGLTVTEDDLTAYGRLIDEVKAMSQTTGELEEGSLENITGGSIISAIYNWLNSSFGGGRSAFGGGKGSFGGGGGGGGIR